MFPGELMYLDGSDVIDTERVSLIQWFLVLASEQNLVIGLGRFIVLGYHFSIYSLFMDIHNSFMDIHNSFQDIHK